MNQVFKTHRRKIIFGLIILFTFIGFKFIKSSKKTTEPTVEAPAEVEKKPRDVSLIEFGVWNPEAYREVLGTVESDNEVEVRAELSGKIGKVFVNVGDQVRAGQALASFDRSGDSTAINYQSALNSLSAAKLSAENSIKSAETAVQNAQRELEKTRIQQSQNKGQSYSGLATTAKNAETTFDNALNFLDRMLGATLEYRTQVVFGRTQIGSTNRILKNKTKTDVENLIRTLDRMRSETAPQDKFQLELFARERLNFAEEIKTAFVSYDQLIINTVISDAFSETDRASIQQQADAFGPSIDSQIAAIRSGIEASKTTVAGTDLTILSAQNRVKSAEEQLALARSQADAQIVAAQNQVNLAAAGQSDLTVRAAISGKLSAKTVRVGDLVSPGQSLFSIVNEAQSKKVVAFLTQDEWLKVQLSPMIKIDVDGEVFEVTEKFLSPKIDAQTQKVLAEFTLPAGSVVVGNLAKVLIPLGTVSADNVANLVPFSSVSFEPDGAEVLVVNEEKIVKRQKIQVGKVVVSNIEVLTGLDKGTKIVEFYKRALPGDLVNLGEEAVEVTEEPIDETTENTQE